jgi:hypothetical protein
VVLKYTPKPGLIQAVIPYAFPIGQNRGETLISLRLNT